MSKIGIIGGSGLYEIDGIKHINRVKVDTPFGEPSDEYTLGELEGREVVFLPRHGKGHRIPPGEINFCANIFGMKKLGVEQIISVTACGSLKREIEPLDFVVPDQFIDRTNQARKTTFFKKGIVAHISFSQPICEDLAKVLYDCAIELGINVHWKGVYLNMEGPAFSTKAESNLYRSWGMDIIGMTNIQEARLAREAEICYATLAAVTDYDCWHESEEDVSVDMILENLAKNTQNAKKILKLAIPRILEQRQCACKDALKFAIITDRKAIPLKIKRDLKLIIGKYVQ
jgi:5'-methylthioadenosine phosphorylase